MKTTSASTSAHRATRPRRAGAGRWATIAGTVLLAVGVLVPTAGSAAHAAAPSTSSSDVTITAAPAPSHSVPDRGEQSLKNAAVGTKVWVRNETSQTMKVGDKVVSPGQSALERGRNASSDDVSQQIRIGDHYSVPLYGHNPPFSEAYVQIGGQKFFDTGKYRHGDFTFDVRFDGTHQESHSIYYYKVWTVTVTDVSPGWDREFVHHTNRDDGVKGYVRNQTDRPVVWESNGHRLELAPGKALLLFDSHRVGPDVDYNGASFNMHHASGRSMEVKAVDPAMSCTKVSVVGYSSFTDFKEGDSQSFNLPDRLKLTVSRANDGKLPVPYETWNTKDWASYNFTLTQR